MNMKNDSRKFAYYLCLVFAVLALRHDSWFENLADLKFFGGIGLPFDLWVKAWPVPDGYLVKNCSEVEETLRVAPRQPVLFKGCIAEEHLGHEGYLFFPESQTNVFPKCKDTNYRHWQFESLDGEVSKMSEWYPCGDGRTLQQKVDEWLSHDPETEGRFSNLHVYMLSLAEKNRLLRGFNSKNITQIDPNFMDSIPVAMSTFLHVGRTVVDYFHSHMDIGLMLNFKATKVWTLIAPDFHDNFDFEWSGNANVLTKENVAAPRVVIEQEQGDLLYMPAWWIHKLSVGREETTKGSCTWNAAKAGECEMSDSFSSATTEDARSFGVNLHMMKADQLSGIGTNIAYYFGITNWFYRDSFDEDSMWGRSEA